MGWTGYKKKPLPARGEAFLVPITKTIFTFAWVVGLEKTRKSYGGKKLGTYVIHDLRIACAAWTGKAPPPAEELEAPAIRMCPDPFVDDSKPGPLVRTCCEPPPRGFKRIGVVKSPAIDVVPTLHGGWTGIQYAVQQSRKQPRKTKKPR